MRTEAVVDSELAAQALKPRTGTVREVEVAPGRFACEAGPFRSYERTVTTESLEDGNVRVVQEVHHRLEIPFFKVLFAWPIAADLARIRGPHSAPWWAPPDTVDAHGSRSLGALCALSLVCGYLGTILTQTITFAAKEFGAEPELQGRVLAATRIDIVIALTIVTFVDRRGRRRPLVAAAFGGVVITALGALSPSLYWLGASQVVAKGLVGGALIAIAVTGAEEMPAGSRAYSFSLLTMSGALGAGTCVLLLGVADAGPRAWRLLYALALVWMAVVWRAGRHLPESRRFARPHVNVSMAGHGGRFWLLAVSAMLMAVFSVPGSQFQNEFLREEVGFSGARISLFTLLTATPGAIGIIVGGRLAEHSRRLVGAASIVGGVGLTVVMFLSTGWPLWAASVGASIIGAAFVPALGVYGPELFPTSLRGRANGLMAGLGRIGSVAGLLLTGSLVERWGGFGPVFAVLAIGPAIVVVLVLALYPETAHRELEELNPEDAKMPPP